MEQTVNKTHPIPKVSVCVITYNQEKFIGQCLQSIVDQKTDFDFEVIVGDDCSKDGTREIIANFADRYPTIVKPIYQKNNIGGGTNNFRTVHQAAVGEYIAHVDGDDYCLPGKLQAQADLLDSDPECNIVFHRVRCLSPSGMMQEGPLFYKRDLEQYHFDRGDIIHFMAIAVHSSKMYRKVMRDYEWPDFPVTDYFANVEHIGEGTARFVGEESFGVYRTGMGIASNGTKSRKALAKSFSYFCRKYPEYRLEANAAALRFFIADLKNFRRTSPLLFLVWLRTFHYSSPKLLLDSIKMIREMRLPS